MSFVICFLHGDLIVKWQHEINFSHLFKHWYEYPDWQFCCCRYSSFAWSCDMMGIEILHPRSLTNPQQESPVSLNWLILLAHLMDNLLPLLISKRLIQMQSNNECNRNRCSILLEKCILCELLSIWKHLRAQFLIIIDSSACLIIREILISHTDGVHSISECYFTAVPFVF